MESIDQAFGPGGWLAQGRANYEVREGQLELAETIAAALRHGGRVIAEAPTGTGKSMAYLVPSALHVVARRSPAGEVGARVVVATANIALQEQLINIDLPTVERLIPGRVRYGLAKGRSHYLCKLREEQNGHVVRARLINEWRNTTVTGDTAEIRSQLDERQRRLLPLLTTSSDDCAGPDCDHYRLARSSDEEPFYVTSEQDVCFCNRARSRLDLCEIIVTNYHLLLADLLVRQASNGTASVLPEHQTVICDEAHRLADIARDFFGDKITPFAIKRLVPQSYSVLKADIEAATDAMFVLVREWHEQQQPNGPSAVATLTKPVPPSFYEPVIATLLATRASVDQAHAGRIDSVIDRLTCIFERRESERYVYFFGEKGEPSSKLIEVGSELNSWIWDQKATVVLTSATLAVDGSFRYVERETGLRNAEQLEVESPFDFERNALLFVDRTMPDPGDRDRRERERWRQLVCKRVLVAIRRNGGRALVLFTSRSMMLECSRYLENQRLDFALLVQTEDASRDRLILQKKNDPTSVLLGLDSFWAGVDLPGDACTMVIIDKIPFPRRDDPILLAMREREGRAAFARHTVPRAAVQLKQGFGRLIRSRTDVGVVLLLDPRIARKQYGRTLLASLPPAPVTSDVEELFDRIEENRRRISM